MQARLPQDKLETAIDLVKSFSRRKKVTLMELQSCIGTLQFAAKVVVGYPGTAQAVWPQAKTIGHPAESHAQATVMQQLLDVLNLAKHLPEHLLLEHYFDTLRAEFMEFAM
ncbi:hypothetical protein LSAT2_027298, partial [Lamellibrachia satsuma]